MAFYGHDLYWKWRSHWYLKLYDWPYMGHSHRVICVLVFVIVAPKNVAFSSSFFEWNNFIFVFWWSPNGLLCFYFASHISLLPYFQQLIFFTIKMRYYAINSYASTSFSWRCVTVCVDYCAKLKIKTILTATLPKRCPHCHCQTLKIESALASVANMKLPPFYRINKKTKQKKKCKKWRKF